MKQIVEHIHQKVQLTDELKEKRDQDIQRLIDIFANPPPVTYQLKGRLWDYDHVDDGDVGIVTGKGRCALGLIYGGPDDPSFDDNWELANRAAQLVYNKTGIGIVELNNNHGWTFDDFAAFFRTCKS